MLVNHDCFRLSHSVSCPCSSIVWHLSFAIRYDFLAAFQNLCFWRGILYHLLEDGCHLVQRQQFWIGKLFQENASVEKIFAAVEEHQKRNEFPHIEEFVILWRLKMSFGTLKSDFWSNSILFNYFQAFILNRKQNWSLKVQTAVFRMWFCDSI